MRIAILFLFLMSFFVLNAQSKKEQIEILNKRIDSLNEVVISENNVNSLNEKHFELQISNIKEQINLLDLTLIKLNQQLSNKNVELNFSKKSIIDKSMEIKALEKKNIEKEDSLKLLSFQIENLKLTQIGNEEINESESIDKDTLMINDFKSKLYAELWDQTDNFKLVRFFGLEGCDATSLFKDSKGVLWLGTGSSGGVYRFDKKYNKWIETNYGIGPVHVSQILEIDNILVIEIFNGENNKEYRYFNGSEWLSVKENQIQLIQSQIQNFKLLKNKKLTEFEENNRERLLKVNIDFKFINTIEIIDNVLYLLDKRGLYYVNNSDNSIGKFNSNGLHATDVYQIIPDSDNKLFIWTNSFQLWEFSKSGWKILGELKYDFSIAKDITNLKSYLAKGNSEYSRHNGFYLDGGRYQKNTIVSNGYVTYSKQKFLLCIFGKLYELDSNKKQFCEKLSIRSRGSFDDYSEIKDKVYLIDDDDYNNYKIKEALYDIDGSLVFTIGSQTGNFDFPVRKTSTTFTQYKDVQIKNHPAIILNDEGRVYGYQNEFISYRKEDIIENFIPLSLSIDNSDNFVLNSAFNKGLFNTTDNSYNSMNNRFLKLSLAQNNIQVSDIFQWSCGYSFHEYYVIEPLKSSNPRFTTFYDDKNGNVFIGTAGSGLLHVRYDISNSINFNSIQIGSQTWMTENLNVSKFRNGDRIPEAKTNEEWIKAREEGMPVWCYYDNDQNNGKIYGKLYNWYAVNDQRGIAPEGWKVPTDSDWIILEKYLGDESGKKMKTKSGWDDYGCKKCEGGSAQVIKICPACRGNQTNSIEPLSGNGTNSSGFSALPGGYRNNDGTFLINGSYGSWWSSTDYKLNQYYHQENSASYLFLTNDNVVIGKGGSNKGMGFSIRCIKKE